MVSLPEERVRVKLKVTFQFASDKKNMHIQNRRFKKHRYCKHENGGSRERFHTYSYGVGTLGFASSSPAEREKQTENEDSPTCTER